MTVVEVGLGEGVDFMGDKVSFFLFSSRSGVVKWMGV